MFQEFPFQGNEEELHSSEMGILSTVFAVYFLEDLGEYYAHSYLLL